MIILVYTKYCKDTIQDNIGESEYSYYYVLQRFLPILKEVGKVVELRDPMKEVDDLYAKAKSDGESCIFLCFSAPHNQFLDLLCPSIAVFAWEYDSIPNEYWGEDPRSNWVEVLKKMGSAITHSEHSVAVVKKELGNSFPIISCPAPLYKFTEKPKKQSDSNHQFTLDTTKEHIDSKTIDFQKESQPISLNKRFEVTHLLLQRWSHEVVEDILPRYFYRFLRNTYLLAGTSIARSVRFLTGKQNLASKSLNITPNQDKEPITGIIYTSILNVFDGRKNVHDMLSAFVYALGDKEDATLIVKTPITEGEYFFREMVLGYLRKLPPFRCRILVLAYYLEKGDYSKLIESTSFYVNTSYGEGQCLPLMEYLSSGIPAIAPKATALEDYINEENSFVLSTAASPTYWQHDERKAIRTVHHRPDWYAIVEAFKESYKVAKEDQIRYRRMSENALQSMKSHAEASLIRDRLKHFLKQQMTESTN